MLKVLSLGAGVQSTTVLMMSQFAELPALDAAVFADTGWEPAEVYRHLEWLEATSIIPIHRVSAGNIRDDLMRSQVRGHKGEGKRWASMPLRVLSDGGQGMIRRQCTREYKIVPIERFIRRELLGLKKGQRATEDSVQHWFGISADEAHRMRCSGRHWVRNHYPLVDLRMTRAACFDWLANKGLPEPPRSACIGCPFRSNQEWRRIKRDAGEWADAVEVDRAVRNMGGMRGEAFLHRSYRPLETANLDEDQLEMWGEECSGVCGV